MHHSNCQQSAAVAIAFWEPAVKQHSKELMLCAFPTQCYSCGCARGLQVLMVLDQHDSSCPSTLAFPVQPCVPIIDHAKQQWLEQRLTLWASPTQPHSCGSVACSMRWSHPATVQRCTGTGTGQLPGPCRRRAASLGFPDPAHSEQ